MGKKINADIIINAVVIVLLILALLSLAMPISKYYRQKQKYAEMDARLEEVTQKTIEVCNTAIDDWGQADEETKSFVQDYIDNINAAETPRQKSYIAQSMAAYVAKLVTYSNYYLETSIENNPNAAPAQTYKWIVNRLNEMVLELRNAREFDYYTGNTEETNDFESETSDSMGNVIIN